jgi:ABC-type amino acid transport substrate-binding protein
MLRRVCEGGWRVRLAVAAVLAAALADPAQAACPAGRARGERGDRLRVGFAPLAPFAVAAGSDGQVGGFAVELLRTLARREGWSLELIELGPATLRQRIADCELDLGVAGAPVSAALAGAVDFSQPYLSTVTTAVVRADDAGRAGPAGGRGPARQIAHAAARGLAWGLAGLLLLVLSSWLLNAASALRGRSGRALRWRRADAAVTGPLACLCWLWRSTTGRVLVSLWVAAGLVLGTTGRTGGARPLVLGEEPLRRLVEEAAHTELLIGERYPDGEHVGCAADETRDCFRGFADGMLAAVAGPREVLCEHVADLALDGVALRDDLAVPERYAFLLPPDSPLRRALDRALLRLHEEARPRPVDRCAGAAR